MCGREGKAGRAWRCPLHRALPLGPCVCCWLWWWEGIDWEQWRVKKRPWRMGRVSCSWPSAAARWREPLEGPAAQGSALHSPLLSAPPPHPTPLSGAPPNLRRPRGLILRTPRRAAWCSSASPSPMSRTQRCALLCVSGVCCVCGSVCIACGGGGGWVAVWLCGCVCSFVLCGCAKDTKTGAAERCVQGLIAAREGHNPMRGVTCGSREGGT